MATYALIHGAGSDEWYWHRVAPLLAERGHEVVAPTLPCDDDTKGFADYADVVIAAIGERTDVIVVAQSLAGYVAPLVAARIPVRLLALVAAMVPRTGESAGEWWAATGWQDARDELARREGWPVPLEMDVRRDFFHDVEPAITDEAFTLGARPQSGTPFAEPWRLSAWPHIATRAAVGRQDRFFPPAFLRGVIVDRLGIEPDTLDSGHLPALARPAELVELLESWRSTAGVGRS